MAGLLVSVRNAKEAMAALVGGADLIDVKEPLAGSLGAATPKTWQEIGEVVGGEKPLSAALGELHDWDGSLPNTPIAMLNGVFQSFEELPLGRSSRPHSTLPKGPA